MISRACGNPEYEAHLSLMNELYSEDPKGFRCFVRLDVYDFEEQFINVSQYIEKKSSIILEVSGYKIKYQSHLLLT